LTSLVKAMDRQLGESAARRPGHNKLGIFVVFCSDDPGLQPQLENLLAREGLQNVVVSLSANKAQGPPRYRIARDAELTVVVYQGRDRVVANYVLDSEDLTADRANDIVQSLRAVLP
jgi:hypothetical protein